jgi:hypothetical protein
VQPIIDAPRPPLTAFKSGLPQLIVPVEKKFPDGAI